MASSTHVGIARRFGQRALERFRPRPRVYASHFDHILGTSMDLRIAARPNVAQLAEDRALNEIERLEEMLSGWTSNSEFAHWQGTRDVAVPVSDELAELLELSEAWRERTSGAFDPAAEEIITAFDASATALIADAVRRVDDEAPRWVVDRTAGTARRLTGCRISLDAIAKGFIVTRAAERAFAVEGVDDVLLNIGGDVQHLGAQSVTVGITNPFAASDNAAPIAVVRLRNQALATSGSYRRSLRAGGSHIVDPRTGVPANHVASASVIAPDCTTADALSTAFSVMLPRESVELANTLPDVGCMVVECDGTLTANAVWKSHEHTASGQFSKDW